MSTFFLLTVSVHPEQGGVALAEDARGAPGVLARLAHRAHEEVLDDDHRVDVSGSLHGAR